MDIASNLLSLGLARRLNPWRHMLRRFKRPPGQPLPAFRPARRLGPMPDDEAFYHRRIREFLAQRDIPRALDEAAAAFAYYRWRGRIERALQVSRAMRLIDGDSYRPYELEIRMFVELDRIAEARRCNEQLIGLHQSMGRLGEATACSIRFDLLTRPRQQWVARGPLAVQAGLKQTLGTPGYLPALVSSGDE